MIYLNGDIDNTAKASGLVTAFALIALNAIDLTQIIITCIAGVFGVASSLAVAWFNHWWRERRERRKRESEKL